MKMYTVLAYNELGDDYVLFDTAADTGVEAKEIVEKEFIVNVIASKVRQEEAQEEVKGVKWYSKTDDTEWVRWMMTANNSNACYA